MREMTNGRQAVKVHEHWITKNFWEFFFLEDLAKNKNIVLALVYGDVTEIGDVPLDEVRPFVMSKTRKLDDLMPAPGWRWL